MGGFFTSWATQGKPKNIGVGSLSLPQGIFELSGKWHIAANGIISLFFMAEYYSIVYTYHIFFIYSSVDGYLGCFHILAVINNATSCGNRLSFTLVVRNFWLDHRKQGVGGNSENMVLMAFTSICHPLCTAHLSPRPRPLPRQVVAQAYMVLRAPQCRKLVWRLASWPLDKLEVSDAWPTGSCRLHSQPQGEFSIWNKSALELRGFLPY